MCVWVDKITNFFNTIIGVKQQCPLTSTLFGLQVCKGRRHKEIFIRNAIIMFLFYEYDVTLLQILSEMHKSLWEHCKSYASIQSWVSVSCSKTNIILVKSQNKDKSCIMYNNEPLKTMENFKYLGLEFLQILIYEAINERQATIILSRNQYHLMTH